MPADSQDRPILLAVGRPIDFSDAPYDGFVARRLRTASVLRKRYELRLLLLRPHHDGADVHPELRPCVIADLPLADLSDDRRTRLRRVGRALVSAPDFTRRDLAIRAVLQRERADVTVTFGPWLEREFTPVFAASPTVHFYEEDLSRMPEIAPQSRQARFLRYLEATVFGRREPQPRASVVIAPSEVAPARRRFPDADVLWYPFIVDDDQFPLAAEASSGADVLVVGQFSEARNAEGLRDVLIALRRLPGAPPISLASQSGTHQMLDEFVEQGQLRNAGFVEDLYARYRSASLTLVPARRATGIKTTILQAWAAGTPVVCFDALTRAFGGVAEGALATYSTPAGVAQGIVGLAADDVRRRSLALAGFRVFRRHFAAGGQDVQLIELLDRTSAPNRV